MGWLWLGDRWCRTLRGIMSGLNLNTPLSTYPTHFIPLDPTIDERCQRWRSQYLVKPHHSNEANTAKSAHMK